MPVFHVEDDDRERWRLRNLVLEPSLRLVNLMVLLRRVLAGLLGVLGLRCLRACWRRLVSPLRCVRLRSRLGGVTLRGLLGAGLSRRLLIRRARGGLLLLILPCRRLLVSALMLGLLVLTLLYGDRLRLMLAGVLSGLLVRRLRLLAVLRSVLVRRLLAVLRHRRLLVLLAPRAVPLRVLLDEIHLASALRARAHGRTARAIPQCG